MPVTHLFGAAEGLEKAFAEAIGTLRAIQQEIGCAVGPIDIREVSRRLGVTRLVQRPLGVPGMLQPGPNGFTVIVNESDGVQRKRFSWAHELGHVLMGQPLQHGFAYRGSSTAFHELERRCDTLASEIIMPEEPVAEALDAAGWSLSSVPVLAKGFNVSMTSAAIRYSDLLGRPNLRLMWQLKSSEPGVLGLMWQKASGMPSGVSYGVGRGPRGESSPFRGAIAAIHSRETMKSRESISISRRASRQSAGAKVAVFDVDTESLGFGRESNRRVISISYLDPVLRTIES